ncbi:MAG: histone deacetylase, partial [Bacteroidota bacterium]
HEGTINEGHFFHPEPLSDEQLLSTHTAEYLDKLKNLPLPRKEERAIGFPVRQDLIHRGRHIAQGTLQCCYHAIESGAALNVAGGTHHAFADHGEGFCVFNDFAIAANLLLAEGSVKQILILDLDVHQGNGTAKIFETESRVFTMSVHGAKNYPLRKTTSDLDIGLPDGTGDTAYILTLEEHLPKLIDQVQPDLIMYLAGVDVLETDKLGRLSLSKEGCMRRDEYVFRLCHRHQIPVAVSMGGGYSHRVADIVEAHANTFKAAQEIFF